MCRKSECTSEFPDWMSIAHILLILHLLGANCDVQEGGYETTDLFNVSIINNTVIVQWDRTPPDFTYYRLDIHYPYDYVEQLHLEIEQKVKVVPIENPCKPTTLIIYGWHKSKTMIKLASFDIGKLIDQMSNIEYFPISNKLFITWKNPSVCLPRSIHITLQQGNTTNEQDVPINPTQLLIREVNWEHFFNISFTPTYLDGIKGKNISMYDIQILEERKIHLNPSVEDDKLFLEWQQDWSFQNRLTVTLVVNDAYHQRFAWPEDDSRIYLSEYNVCNKYEIRLLEYSESGLWQPRGYRLLMPETVVYDAHVGIQVFHLGTQIWVTWNTKAWCRQESLLVEPTEAAMIHTKKYAQNSKSGALFPNPHQISDPVICINAYSGVSWFRRHCRRRPDHSETPSFEKLNITRDYRGLTVNWKPLSDEHKDYKLICLDERDNTHESNVTLNSTDQLISTFHKCLQVTCILAAFERPGKVSPIAYEQTIAETVKITDIAHFQTPSGLLITWTVNGPCPAQEFEVTLLNAFGQIIGVRRVKKKPIAIFKNINNGSFHHVKVKAFHGQSVIGESKFAVMRTNKGIESLQLSLRVPADMIEFTWINDHDCHGRYSLLIFKNGEFFDVSKLVTKQPTMQFRILSPCDQYLFGLTEHCPSGESRQIGQAQYNGRQPMQPEVNGCAGGHVQVDWTTNVYCPPQSVSLILQAESETISVKTFSTNTTFITYDDLRLCTNYKFYLSHTYADGKDFISKPTEKNFMEGLHPNRYQRIQNFHNGTVVISWRFRTGCKPQLTSMTMTTNGNYTITLGIPGNESYTVLRNLKTCAFYTIKLSMFYSGSIVETNEIMEFDTFPVTKFDNKMLMTFVVDEVLEVSWGYSVYCSATSYVVRLINTQTGDVSQHNTSEFEYAIPLGPAKVAYQLELSGVYFDKEITLSKIRTIHPDQVPPKPRPPYVKSVGNSVKVWWPKIRTKHNITSYGLEIFQNESPATTIYLPYETNVYLLHNARNYKDYVIRLRKINKYGASPLSDPAIFTSFRGFKTMINH